VLYEYSGLPVLLPCVRVYVSNSEPKGVSNSEPKGALDAFDACASTPVPIMAEVFPYLCSRCCSESFPRKMLPELLYD
jgi:hypothetical protein